MDRGQQRKLFWVNIVLLMRTCWGKLVSNVNHNGLKRRACWFVGALLSAIADVSLLLGKESTIKTKLAEKITPSEAKMFLIMFLVIYPIFLLVSTIYGRSWEIKLPSYVQCFFNIAFIGLSIWLQKYFNDTTSLALAYLFLFHLITLANLVVWFKDFGLVECIYTAVLAATLHQCKNPKLVPYINALLIAALKYLIGYYTKKTITRNPSAAEETRGSREANPENVGCCGVCQILKKVADFFSEEVVTEEVEAGEIEMGTSTSERTPLRPVVREERLTRSV